MNNFNYQEQIIQKLDNLNLSASIAFVKGFPSKIAIKNISIIKEIFYHILFQINSLNVFDFNTFVNQVKNDDRTMLDEFDIHAVHFFYSNGIINNTDFLKDVIFLIHDKDKYKNNSNAIKLI
ncbi:MAG: hypothetical protein RLZZ546_1042 [Bacteroidota bacterium]|jgi:hypothetical protein